MMGWWSGLGGKRWELHHCTDGLQHLPFHSWNAFASIPRCPRTGSNLLSSFLSFTFLLVSLSAFSMPLFWISYGSVPNSFTQCCFSCAYWQAEHFQHRQEKQDYTELIALKCVESTRPVLAHMEAAHPTVCQESDLWFFKRKEVSSVLESLRKAASF